MGGTIAQLTGQGTTVAYLITTNGDKGGQVRIGVVRLGGQAVLTRMLSPMYGLLVLQRHGQIRLFE